MLEFRSVTSTDLIPAVEMGTTNVVEKEPTPFVLVAPIRINDAPLNVAFIGEEAAKPAPLIVTVELTRPLFGFKLMPGITLKNAVNELVPSVS